VLHALTSGTVATALAVALAGPPASEAAGDATPEVSEVYVPAGVSGSDSTGAPESDSGGGDDAASEVAPGFAPEPAPGAGAWVGPAEGPEPGRGGPVPAWMRPPRPPGDGRGLLIAAGAMAVLNVGLAAARLGLSLGESTAEREQARLILTAGVMPVNVAAGIGLAAGGGYLRGRIDGYRSAFDREPKLRARAFTASGTILLVMGAVAWASAWTPWYGDASLDARGGGSLVVESVGSLLLMGGSGLLAYGVSWQRHTDRYMRTLPVKLQLNLSARFAGLGLGGRF